MSLEDWNSTLDDLPMLDCPNWPKLMGGTSQPPEDFAGWRSGEAGNWTWKGNIRQVGV